VTTSTQALPGVPMAETTPPAPTLPERSTLVSSVLLYIVSIATALGLSAILVW
jgi:hypothetical protein